jgi:4'-phosphopantetheinyl transferase
MDFRAAMELSRVFAAALPSLQWGGETDDRVLVALAHAGDWKPWLSDAVALIDTAETERMQRRRNPRDREILALAYALHRLLLARALNVEPHAVPVWRDALGCPRVGDGKLYTSLSHADSWLAFALSGAGPVGVDIEPLARADAMPEIADSVCHPAEAVALDALPADGYAEALLALWVRKEAALKAAGVGLSREMSGFAAPEGLVSLDGAGETSCIQMLQQAAPACLAAVAGPCGVPVGVVRLTPDLA